MKDVQLIKASTLDLWANTAFRIFLQVLLPRSKLSFLAKMYFEKIPSILQKFNRIFSFEMLNNTIK